MGAQWGTELARGRAVLVTHEPGRLVAFEERLSVLDCDLCHETVTNSISSQLGLLWLVWRLG